MNVLITSAGRRSYIVRFFQEALAGRGQVIAANIYASQATAAADRFYIVPPSFDEDYIPTILDICRRHQIKLLLSLHDLDVHRLAQARDQFEQIGAYPLVPDPELSELCLDKYKGTRHLNKHGFKTPWVSVTLEKALNRLRDGRVEYPLVLKARMGFGSLGLHTCHNEYELIQCYEMVKRQVSRSVIPRIAQVDLRHAVLIQQFVRGQEFCVDIVHDFQARPAAIFMCMMHAMRAGETDEVTTLDNRKINDLAARLGQLTQHAGVLGFDVILDRGIPRIIDMNPRFTGDYPFHHVAGANIPAALIAWRLGEPVNPDWLRPRPGFRGYKELIPVVYPEKRIHQAEPDSDEPGST